MASITFTHVNKTYPGNVEIVPDLNLEIKDKEFVILVGPSGCGKSTTLRMIAGLEDITSGELRIGDRVVNDIAPKDRDIAMVFQNYALYPHMSVYKNIAFGLQLRKVPREEIDKKVHEAARILDLEHLLDRKPKALSGGQRQRVALGRAMVRDPAVFLLDEPLSNLDAKLRTSMRTEISKLHRKLDTTFVYVTHDQTEAMTMGDRICVMKDGIIQQFDNPQVLYDSPCNLFVAGFIGSPQMNFITAKIVKSGKGVAASFDRFTLPMVGDKGKALAGYVGKEVIIGIRPEDFLEVTDAIPENEQLTANIEIVELMGSETNLYMDCAGTKLIARMPSNVRPSEQTQYTIGVKVDKIHVFDKDTEKAICH
ncbi:MAG TPA: sn-glycerol-3-phosphate ABC transporter ATP-binding protein UgpC [Candidatus Butyricicoccus stercorigallinarum]|nr:sn-glycerol-3-phosphate ABC transporter ATP-binding protein UgpC [Candidatus Butyricicoccus stercorigallinarum]